MPSGPGVDKAAKKFPPTREKTSPSLDFGQRHIKTTASYHFPGTGAGWNKTGRIMTRVSESEQTPEPARAAGGDAKMG